MTETTSGPVLAALIRVAVAATGASRGRILRAFAGRDQLRVVAVLGGDAAWRSATAVPTDSGIAGFVVATGQPQVLARQQHPVLGMLAPGASALCVPCLSDDEVVGAMELVDKPGGGAFSIDDLELAGLLGGIAGVALAAYGKAPAPDPAALVGDFSRLAATEPARYDTIARLVKSLLDA